MKAPSLFKLLPVLILAYTANAQVEPADYNKWSLELSTGLSKAIYPYAPGYHSNTVNFANGQLGIRYMMNNDFGVKLDFGYASIDDGKNSLPFHTNYLRSSIQGVVNLHNVWNFQNWTKRFGLQFHGGLGYSTMGNDSLKPFQQGRNMVNFIGGLSPMFKINERLTVKLDASFIAHIYQEYKFDMSRTHGVRGFDGLMSTLTVGLHISLGKHARHADWVPNGQDDSRLRSLEQRLDSLNRAQGDDDNDGVANAYDREQNTAAGAKVDTHGVTILPANQRDTDGDGVMDDKDLCPEIAGAATAKGCVDSDKDGVPDLLDNCPNEAGTPGGNGCPRKSPNSLSAYRIENIMFETDKAVVRPEYYEYLDSAVRILNGNRSLNIALVGRADERASRAHNEVLSLERATACQNYLIKKGISKDRIKLYASGEDHPIYAGESIESFAGNRSVEMIIK